MNATAQTPDAWMILRDAWREAPRRIASDNFINYVLLAIFSVIDGANMRNDTRDEAINNPFPLTGLLGYPVFYFALAAALRLRNPAFAMRIGHAFGIFLANLMVFLITLAGMILFIVPGIWAGTRVSLAPYVVAGKDGSTLGATEALAESWRLTEGCFWQTLVFFVWLILMVALPLALLYFVALLVFFSAHITAYFSAPVLMLATVVCVQVSTLALLAWTEALALGKAEDTRREFP